MTCRLTPEYRFLFLCARTKLTDAHREQIRDLAAQAVDWEKLVEIGGLNWLSSFVYRAMVELEAEGLVPERAMDKLKGYYFRTHFRNGLQAEEMQRILPTLDAAGVPIMLLKGTALTHAVYGDLGLHPSCDVDVLLKQKDFGRAIEVMSGLGYSGPRPGGDLTGWDALADLHPSPFKRIGGPIIEPHFWFMRPHANHPIDMEEIWDRSVKIDIGGVSACVPSPEDMLLHQCLHLSMVHLYFSTGARDLCTIAEIISHSGQGKLAWDYLKQTAQRGRLEQYLYYPIYVADELFGLSLDRSVYRGFKFSKWQVRAAEECTLLSRHVFSDLRKAPRRGWRAKLKLLWDLRYLPDHPIAEVYSFRSPFHRTVAHYRWLADMVRLGMAVRDALPSASPQENSS